MNTQKMKWVRFCKLKTGEDFFLGRFRYTKTSYFLGHAVLDGNVALAMPWTKVRSTRPFGKQNRLDLIVDDPRPSVPVTPGGDRRSETIGGNELTPSA